MTKYLIRPLEPGELGTWGIYPLCSDVEICRVRARSELEAIQTVKPLVGSIMVRAVWYPEPDRVIINYGEVVGGK